MMAENTSFDRRKFVKVTLTGAAAAAGLKLAKGALASEAKKGKRQWAMVIDLTKCTGCGYCTKACRAHNEDAPCVDVCPVKANTYRDDGLVMMNYDRCIGCRYCEVACPYEARAFNWEAFTGENPYVPEWGHPEVPRRPRGVVEKCTFCYQRIDRGLSLGLEPGVDPQATPACVVGCPVGARIFGDLNDPESPVSKVLDKRVAFRLRDELGTKPRVYYLFPSEIEEAGT